MKFRHSDRDKQEIKLDMTAMIDVVFQLLIFFVMTFKTPIYEGDFGIKMPRASNAPSQMTETTTNPMLVRLMADNEGHLQSLNIVFQTDSINYNFDPNNPAGIFRALNEYVIGIVGGQRTPTGGDIEAELEIDFQLRYDYTVKAIEAVSGYREGDQVVTLIEKINFKDTQ
ncbi:MAG TPA: biopolymer transporter ExbD [Pirellulaceae bacterium]|nr:biopolymer transporter ExbD [Pirellulaceae bacterium]HMO91264.1 biopolymer transporter ExbD [Pirellulaceae bacterium]HMP68552.1 biopolymer transporter ExbD [Pirellulaceae bacterium]